MCCYFLAISYLISLLPWTEFRTGWPQFTEETTEHQLRWVMLRPSPAHWDLFAGSKFPLVPNDSDTLWPQADPRTVSFGRQAAEKALLVGISVRPRGLSLGLGLKCICRAQLGSQVYGCFLKVFIIHVVWLKLVYFLLPSFPIYETPYFKVIIKQRATRESRKVIL